MKEIQLTQGYVAKVDDADYDRLIQFFWSAELKARTGLVYASRTREGTTRRIYMHWDVLPRREGFLTDHRNRDTLDNRRENLRYATRSQSNANTRTYSSTGFRGVYQQPGRRQFGAYIKIGGSPKYLGSFLDKVEAAKAYDEAAKEVHGEFATLNFQ